MGALRLEEYSTREQAAQALQAHRQLNGTQEAHPSREFFEVSEGKPITEKEARRQAVRQHRKTTGHPTPLPQGQQAQVQQP